MRKILKVIAPLTIFGTLISCGGTQSSVSSSSQSETPSYQTSTSVSSNGTGGQPSSVVSTMPVDEYRVELPQEKGFEITSNNATPEANATVEIYVKNLNPNARRLDALKMNGEDLVGKKTNTENVTLFTFQMPMGRNAVVTVEAVDVYAVTVSNSVKDVLSLSGIGTGLFAAGETVTFRPTTYAGFWYNEIALVDSDVTLTRDGDNYSFVMPSHLVTVTATTGENVYLVRCASDPNYSVSLEKETAVEYGARVTFRVTLNNPDLEIVSVAVDGDPLQDSAGVYAFSMPAHPVLISVTYQKVYKQITVADSDHFTASLTTVSEEGKDPVAVTEDNVLSDQKVLVSVTDKTSDAEHNFIVDSISVFGATSAEDIYTDLELPVVEETENVFCFVTPSDYRFLRVEIKEKENVGIPSGAFLGFAPNSSTGGDQELTISEDGLASASLYSNTPLTAVETNHFTLEFSFYSYIYYYDFFFHPSADMVFEFNAGYKNSPTGDLQPTYRNAATKVYVKDSLYTSDYYSIIIKDSSTGIDDYIYQFYSISCSDGTERTCFYNYETKTVYWDVGLTLVSGADGKTGGDVVEIKTVDGDLLVKASLSGTKKNVQFDATAKE